MLGLSQTILDLEGASKMRGRPRRSELIDREHFKKMSKTDLANACYTLLELNKGREIKSSEVFDFVMKEKELRQ